MTIGGRQSPGARDSPRLSMWFSSRAVASAPSRSALLTTTSPISRIPALAAWIPSPMPGARRTTDVSAWEAISTSDLPTPTVSTRTTSSRPRRGRGWPAARTRRGRPDGRGSPWSGCRRRGRRRAPTSGPGLRAARRRRTARTGRRPGRRPACPACGTRFTSAEVDVDLPTPGEPVRPTTYALPVSGARAAMTSLQLRGRPLHQGDQPGHGTRGALPGPCHQSGDVLHHCSVHK
ncbi:hypothetical protein SHIRM173S_09605 [Streptomyces hirsutus]